MSLHNYFMNEFPHTITAYRAAVLSLRTHQQQEPPCHCVHDEKIPCDPSQCGLTRPWRRVPAERATELTAPPHPRFKESNFWFSWYIVTLLNEGIHSHFRESYPQWVAEYGADPIPMIRCGLAGWQVARPYDLLRYASRDTKRWAEVSSFITETTPPRLRSVGIDPVVFFESLVADEDFARHSRIETLLADHLRAYCDAQNAVTKNK
ncbi:MAG TPA: hypothetical protein PLI09_03065 [Candidatus Hydrogenedentes bacterium]|nr:hypothetical protein [Candidatus Hydrogenedentota bacterium]